MEILERIIDSYVAKFTRFKSIKYVGSGLANYRIIYR